MMRRCFAVLALCALVAMFSGCATDIATRQDIDFAKAETASDIESISRRLNELQTRLDNMSDKLDIYSNKIDEMKPSLVQNVKESMQTMQDGMQSDITAVKSGVETLRKDLDAVNARAGKQEEKLDLFVKEVFAQLRGGVSGAKAANKTASSSVKKPSQQTEAPPSKESGSAVYHTVDFGENLTTIARRYGVTASQIISLNNLENPNSVVVGQKLLISEDAVSAQDSAETEATIQ